MRQDISDGELESLDFVYEDIDDDQADLEEELEVVISREYIKFLQIQHQKQQQQAPWLCCRLPSPPLLKQKQRLDDQDTIKKNSSILLAQPRIEYVPFLADRRLPRGAPSTGFQEDPLDIDLDAPAGTMTEMGHLNDESHQLMDLEVEEAQFSPTLTRGCEDETSTWSPTKRQEAATIQLGNDIIPTSSAGNDTDCWTSPNSALEGSFGDDPGSGSGMDCSGDRVCDDLDEEGHPAELSRPWELEDPACGGEQWGPGRRKPLGTQPVAVLPPDSRHNCAGQLTQGAGLQQGCCGGDGTLQLEPTADVPAIIESAWLLSARQGISAFHLQHPSGNYYNGCPQDLLPQHQREGREHLAAFMRGGEAVGASNDHHIVWEAPGSPDLHQEDEIQEHIEYPPCPIPTSASQFPLGLATHPHEAPSAPKQDKSGTYPMSKGPTFEADERSFSIEVTDEVHQSSLPGSSQGCTGELLTASVPHVPAEVTVSALPSCIEGGPPLCPPSDSGVAVLVKELADLLNSCILDGGSRKPSSSRRLSDGGPRSSEGPFAMYMADTQKKVCQVNQCFQLLGLRKRYRLMVDKQHYGQVLELDGAGESHGTGQSRWVEIKELFDVWEKLQGRVLELGIGPTPAGHCVPSLGVDVLGLMSPRYKETQGSLGAVASILSPRVVPGEGLGGMADDPPEDGPSSGPCLGSSFVAVGPLEAQGGPCQGCTSADPRRRPSSAPTSHRRWSMYSHTSTGKPQDGNRARKR